MARSQYRGMASDERLLEYRWPVHNGHALAAPTSVTTATAQAPAHAAWGTRSSPVSAAPTPTPASTATLRFSPDANLYVVRSPAAPGTLRYASSRSRPNGVGEWTGNAPAVTNAPRIIRNRKNS